MPTLNTLLYLSILLLGGLLLGRLLKQVKLPNVTGYLLAGLLVGPYVLKVIPPEVIGGLDTISEIALSFIAFTIGSEFKLSYFKRVGLTPIVIAVCEALLAVLVVQGVLIAAGFNTPFAIILGSIAAATAPAATIMVVKQYKAKGPVTETLLSVVALDDAVALIAFGFAVTIAKAVSGGSGDAVLISVLRPFGEILLALAIGGAVGAVFKLPLKFFRKTGNRLIIMCGLVTVSQTIVPEYAAQLRAVILCGTLIYEIIGPAITKLALVRAGEIDGGKKPALAGKAHVKFTST